MFTSEYTKVLLPPISLNTISNLEPQQVMVRAPNVGSLDIDSRKGMLPDENSSRITIATNSTNTKMPPLPLLASIRRVAIKHLELFYYLDNIILGYNDTCKFAVNLDLGPITQTFEITLTPGVYDLAGIAQNIQDNLNAWFIANWTIPLPAPIAAVTVIPSVLGFPGLLGSINITITNLTMAISIDPACTFIANSSNMLVLSASNTYPQPSALICKINFFNLSPYNYIDVVSDALTQNNRVKSATNTPLNYNKILRIYSPSYGLNKYDYSEPLTWLNINYDTYVYNMDFRFLDSSGNEILTAVTKNFWWLMQLVYEI